MAKYRGAQRLKNIPVRYVCVRCGQDAKLVRSGRGTLSDLHTLCENCARDNKKAK